MPNMKTINRKIPGQLIPLPKSEIDGKVTDLTSKTLSELLELRERQTKLLSNNGFISKLSDKGKKIQSFHDKIDNEINNRQNADMACKILSELKLNHVDRDSIQNVEWEGKVNGNKNVYLDSDDDSDPENVLQILSQNTQQQKNIKHIKSDPPLVTIEDLKKIDETSHIEYIVSKTEKRLITPCNFKPYKTTISDVHDPQKEKSRKVNKHWENTAATPPLIKHGPTKVLSIEESLQLQKDHTQHLKEVEAQHAAEKLLERMGMKISNEVIDTSKFGTYRDPNEDTEESDPEGSDKEVYDEEPEKGGVVFTVMK